MTKGELMVAFGISGLALTFIILIITISISNKRERKALAAAEKGEPVLDQDATEAKLDITEVNATGLKNTDVIDKKPQQKKVKGVVETDILDREKIETSLMETAVIKDAPDKTDIM